jgi:hypothetical protein
VNRSDALLLAALRQPAPELFADADWPALLHSATCHNIAPLLYYRLRAAGVEIHEAFRQPWREAYLAAAGENVRRFHELGRVLRAFAERGVAVIALKGAHLAPLVYEKMALRPMSDIDLLLREADLAAADETLRRLGYLAEGSNARFVEEHLHASYVLPGKEWLIEVHHNLEMPVAPLRIDTAGLWRRASPAVIAEAPALVLCAEDLLLHLCLHASAHHAFDFGLRPLCDIAETLRCYGGELEWAALVARAKEWGAGRSVYLTLLLADKLVGAALPAGLLAALDSGDLDPSLLAWAEERILSEQTGAPFRGLSESWALHGWDKVAFFCKAAFPSRQRMAQLYPAAQGSARLYHYYLLRLWQLLRQRVVTAWRRWRRDPQTLAHSEREAMTTELVKWLISG